MVDLLDNNESCWGYGVIIKGLKMSQSMLHKILYVAVHLEVLDLSFTFRPFDSNYEVHQKYVLSKSGESFTALESVWIEGTVHCLRIRRGIQE